MIDLTLLPDGGLGWLDASGPESHLVLSTRIRLARNLAGRAFVGRNSESEREGILRDVEQAARDTVLLRQAARFRLDRLDAVERQLLHERHLVSRELAGLGPDARTRSGSALLVQDRVGVMLNEEDHLRLQALQSGFALDAAYAELDRVDTELGQRLAFAFHPEFGYLTSCPTNVGTGLRASVLIHLPGLVLTKEISKVLQGLSQVGLTFRGLYGEGSEVVGNFFQISNQTTLGKTEEDLIDHLQRIVQQVVQYETQARAVLLRDARTVIEDKVWRAYGILAHARSTGFEEVMNLLSGVRLGVGLDLIRGLRVYTLNRIMIFAQAAHLELADGGAADPDPDVRRAAYVRQALAAEPVETA